MRERWRAIPLGLAVLLAPPADAATPAPCGVVALPTNVTVGPPDPPATAHPVLATGSASEQSLINQLYQPMIWLDRHAQIDFGRSLAEHIDVDPSDQVFTITLRPWHWSDGSDVTSADVLYAWSLIRAAGHTYFNYDVGGVPGLIRSISAPDPRTVVVRTSKRVNPIWFEQLGIGQLTPLPSHDWSRWSVAQQQSMQSEASFYRLVDGPFRLQALDLGRQAVLDANPRYDGEHPLFARYIASFQVGADPLESLRAGQLDAAFLPFALWNAADRMRDFQRVPLGSLGSISSLVLNLRNPAKPFLADRRVRQAIARAINQPRMIGIVFHGQSRPQEGFVATSRTNDIPPELRNGGGPMSFDPAAARALLDATGWRPGPDGIRRQDGRRLAFQLLITAGAEDEVLMAQLAQADLAAVGIALSIKEVEFNQLTARVLGPHDGWDAVFFAWSAGGYPDGTQWFASGSQGNFGGYSDQTMDRLLDAANSTPGDGPLFALERYVVQQQPMIFLPDGDTTILARVGLGGLRDLAGFGGELSVNRLFEAGGCAGPRA